MILRGCERTRAIVPAVLPATEEDFYTEYNDLIMAVKVVDGVDGAIGHINKYGSQHSEAIITQDAAAAERFMNLVDAGGRLCQRLYAFYRWVRVRPRRGNRHFDPKTACARADGAERAYDL